MAAPPPINSEIVTQMLHRAVGTVGTVVVAAFVLGNWLLAHLSSNWVMPPEVVGTVQQGASSLAVLWIFNRAIKKYGLAIAAAAIDGAAPTPPAPKATIPPSAKATP